MGGKIGVTTEGIATIQWIAAISPPESEANNIIIIITSASFGQRRFRLAHAMLMMMFF